MVCQLELLVMDYKTLLNGWFSLGRSQSQSQSRSHNQKCTTLWLSENSVLILLMTGIIYNQVKTRLSEPQTEAEELIKPFWLR